MDINLIRTLVTLVSFLIFLAIVFWAYRPANRNRFEADGQIVFDESVSQERT